VVGMLDYFSYFMQKASSLSIEKWKKELTNQQVKI
jgi:hypothetical protein